MEDERKDNLRRMFASDQEFDHWLGFCRTLVRKLLVVSVFGPRALQHEDELFQQLMLNLLLYIKRDKEKVKNIYGFAANTARYVLKTFKRETHRETDFDRAMEEYARSRGNTEAKKASYQLDQLIEIEPDMGERERAFIAYVLENGFDIENLDDRAKILERFELTAGAYRTFMTRLRDNASDLREAMEAADKMDGSGYMFLPDWSIPFVIDELEAILASLAKD